MKKNTCIALLAIIVVLAATINMAAAETENIYTKDGFVVLVQGGDARLTKVFKSWQKSATTQPLDGEVKMIYGYKDCEKPGKCSPKTDLVSMKLLKLNPGDIVGSVSIDTKGFTPEEIAKILMGQLSMQKTAGEYVTH